ncbi:glycosyltransferase [Haloglycomyces albus]|uniref:glycosyltransferase n=1 Tax=Haloglycomyces albus TaxID=526067 RepID=UPI00046D6365|nr:glycosyltransferase [Haloglycomyces albus]
MTGRSFYDRIPSRSDRSWAGTWLSRGSRRALEDAEAKLYFGWSKRGQKRIKKIMKGSGRRTRLAALNLRSEWRRWDARERDRAVRATVDVLVVSHLALPGGNSSAIKEEVRAMRNAGLNVGLLHHPVRGWDISRPLNPKIAEMIDGESVRLFGSYDDIHARLTIIRLPTVALALREDMPRLKSDKTVVVVNQTPFKYYENGHGIDQAWDVASVQRNVSNWLGPHTWFAVGPAVREALETYHADDMREVDLSDDYWYESIDVAAWPMRPHREVSRPIVIGRHARDHALKWPRDAEQLRSAYPTADDITVKVLGGSDIPRRRLGSLPAHWEDIPFGGMDVRRFLHSLDFMVYFIDPDAREAFGYAPMEAMAAGVPVVCDSRFRPLFGEAAIYCEPAEVEETVREFADSVEKYRSQVERAREEVQTRFSYESLLCRLDRLMKREEVSVSQE